VKRSLIDGNPGAHVGRDPRELSGINAEMVGADMHRRMVEPRRAPQEEACSDLAKRMIQFGEELHQELAFVAAPSQNVANWTESNLPVGNCTSQVPPRTLHLPRDNSWHASCSSPRLRGR